MLLILSILFAETAPGFNQVQNDLIDPRFAQEPGITLPQASFVYSKRFSGPSLTNLDWFAPDDGTGELKDPLSTQHSFVFRTPLTFAPKIQFSIKPGFMLNFKNTDKEGATVQKIDPLNTVFDLSRELFDNNKISYSGKVGILVPTSVSALSNRQYISPILGHSLTIKALSKFIFNIENSFTANFFHEKSTKKHFLSTVLELNTTIQFFEKLAFKATYDTKFTSDTKDNFFSITNNIKHLIHLGLVVTYFKDLTIYPHITLNAKNNFKNPSINWVVTKKFF